HDHGGQTGVVDEVARVHVAPPKRDAASLPAARPYPNHAGLTRTSHNGCLRTSVTRVTRPLRAKSGRVADTRRQAVGRSAALRMPDGVNDLTLSPDPRRA